MTLEPTIILLVIAALVVAFGLYVLLYRKQRLSQGDTKKVKENWSKILTQADSQPEQAILNADKLLDFVLKKAGFHGTLGEKMKAAKSVFSDNNAIWSAHKLRNRIAHEVDVKLSPQMTKGALSAYKKAFSDLGISL